MHTGQDLERIERIRRVRAALVDYRAVQDTITVKEDCPAGSQVSRIPAHLTDSHMSRHSFSSRLPIQAKNFHRNLMSGPSIPCSTLSSSGAIPATGHGHGRPLALRNPAQAAQLGRQAAAHCDQRFYPDVVAGQMVEFYRRVVSKQASLLLNERNGIRL
jgi:hypothetical protein